MATTKPTVKPTATDGIRKLTYPSGKAVYRLVVDAGPDPKTGTRRQLTSTHRTMTAARKERTRILAERDKGMLVLPDRKLTTQQACAAWLKGRRKISDSTRRTYTMELRQVTEAFGAVPVQALTRARVEQLVADMESGKARRIGRPGEPLSASSIRMAVGRLAQVLDDQVKQGNVARNVARLVETPELPKRPDQKGWALPETKQFLRHARTDRLYVCWLLSLHGLRRHEVLGMTWEAVDLDAGTLSVRKSKTDAGVRELPLTPPLVPALRAHKTKLAAECLAAGEAYTVTDHLAADPLGQPVTAEWYSDEWKRQVKAAGLPACTLHSARHTADTQLYELTKDPWLCAAWLGHSRGTFNMQRYVDKPRLEAMRAAGERFGALLDPDVRVS